MDKLHNIRREYDRDSLEREQLRDDPIEQFTHWLQEAIDLGLQDPNAMTVATVSADGQPSQRIVLLKDVSERGFVFYTNLESRKAQEIKHNAKISLHFPWHGIERQVKVCGVAATLSHAENSQYFLSRPKESQIAAWASDQSQPIASKQVLQTKFEQIRERFKDADMTLPEFWGGYRVIPHEIEFWQGGVHRLHDRFVYTLSASEPHWQVTRLMP